MKLKGGGISKKNTIVIYSGRFQPFHKGHHDVYRFLKERYDNVFIVTTNTKSKDKKRYPFNFNQKVDIMKKLGRVEEIDIYPEPVSNPYSDFYILNHIKYLKSISDTLPIHIKKRINNIDLKNTLVLFAISDKDMHPGDGTKPRFTFPENNLVFTKKTNNRGNLIPAKIQKIKSRKHFRNTTFNNIRSNTNTKFNYILTVPTNIFNILGENINSATQLRNMIVDPPRNYTSINVLEALYDIKSNKSNRGLFEFMIETIKDSYGLRSNSASATITASKTKKSNSASATTMSKTKRSNSASATITASKTKRSNSASATITVPKTKRSNSASKSTLASSRRSTRLKKKSVSSSN